MLTDYAERTTDLNSVIKKTFTSRSSPKIVCFAPLLPPVRWVNRLTKGDIMITGRGIGGLVGHAAIMADDYWVLEMPGGDGWQHGIEDNNRRISKHDWLELHKGDRTTLYRNTDQSVAHDAADWAYKNYYNRYGGSEKTQHITYRLTNDIWGTDESYCSKLVVQAFHLGTGNRNVIRDLTALDQFIVPTTLPSYFLRPYTVVNVGVSSFIEGFINSMRPFYS